MLRRLFPNVYEGWLVVGSFALLIVMIGTAFFYGFGTIFTPVIADFGWSNAQVSLAFALRSEVGGIAAPAIGLTIDRFGPQRSLFAGVVISAAGIFGMSYMQNLWQFYFAMFVIAVGVSASGGPVGMVATATWFERRRGQALSFLTVGGGVAGLGVPVVAWLVESLGWRDALRALAGAILAVGLFATSNVRSRPVGHHQPLDGAATGPMDEGPHDMAHWGVPPRQVMLSRAFLAIAMSQATVGFATVALIVHIIPFMESQGVSKTAAASAVTVYTLVSLVGRLGCGYLADRFSKRLVLAGACAVVAVGMPLLAVTTTLTGTLLVMVLIAPGFGGTIPVRPAVLADYFGTRYFGTVNGAMTLVQTLGSFFGPWLVGALVDATGAYTVGWLVCAAFAALSVPLMLLATPPHRLIETYRDGRPAPQAVT
jgi:MFS transporter, OFA family, oxalate/formate antiporter